MSSVQPRRFHYNFVCSTQFPAAAAAAAVAVVEDLTKFEVGT